MAALTVPVLPEVPETGRTGIPVLPALPIGEREERERETGGQIVDGATSFKTGAGPATARPAGRWGLMLQALAGERLPELPAAHPGRVTTHAAPDEPGDRLARAWAAGGARLPAGWKGWRL